MIHLTLGGLEPTFWAASQCSPPGHQEAEAEMAGPGEAMGAAPGEAMGGGEAMGAAAGEDYKLLSHNCQSFAVELVSLLLPNVDFPSEYCGAAGKRWSDGARNGGGGEARGLKMYMSS